MPRTAKPKRVTCAECKRLKLKCDREVPCGTCIKRGYTHLCPNGVNVTGEGHRLLRAGASELRGKMTTLSDRIRALENALRTSHAQNSTTGHPLLGESLLAVARVPQNTISSVDSSVRVSGSSLSSSDYEQRSSSPDEEDDADVFLDALGSLAITDKGNSRYFGQSAGSWRFLMNDRLDDHLLAHRRRLRQHFDVSLLATFGICSLALQTAPYVERHDSRLVELRQGLPSLSELQCMEDNYYKFSAIVNYAALSRASFFSLREAVYAITIAEGEDPIEYHRLAAIFAFCACSVALDPCQPLSSPRAERYAELARASLFSGHAAEYPTVEAIQAMLLLVIHLHYLEPSNTVMAAWNMLGSAIRMAQTMGLHRDPQGWGLPKEEVARRRHLYWALLGQDSWQALQYGLPPSIHRTGIDARFPFPEDSPTEDVYTAWKLRFARDVLSELHARIFAASRPSYASILAADARIRTHALPASLQIQNVFGDNVGHDKQGQEPDLALVTQRQMANMLREYVILVLHRAHFDLATSSFRDAPLKSPYGTSVVAAYRAAWAYVANMQTLYVHAPNPLVRMWSACSGLFTAGVVLGTIAARCPDLPFATQSLIQFGIAYDLFRTLAPSFGERANAPLETLAKLFDTGEKVLTQQFPQNVLAAFADADVLPALGGKTRKLTCPITHKPITLVEPSPRALRLTPAFVSDGELHPTIERYMELWTGEMAPGGTSASSADMGTWENALRTSQEDSWWEGADLGLDLRVEPNKQVGMGLGMPSSEAGTASEIIPTWGW